MFLVIISDLDFRRRQVVVKIHFYVKIYNNQDEQCCNLALQAKFLPLVKTILFKFSRV
jgi:hypothetical protein